MIPLCFIASTSIYPSWTLREHPKESDNINPVDQQGLAPAMRNVLMTEVVEPLLRPHQVLNVGSPLPFPGHFVAKLLSYA